MKKRPVCVVRGAHAGGAGAAAEGDDPAAGAEASAWVQSVAVCRGSDLVVRPSPARSRARKHWAPGRQRACVHAEAAAVCTHVATMLTAPVWPLHYLKQGAGGVPCPQAPLCGHLCAGQSAGCPCEQRLLHGAAATHAGPRSARQAPAPAQASGAGDGAVRLWAVEGAPGKRALRALGGLRAPGFVNGLALARSGRFALAGLGAEPRLGRWEVARGVRSGLLLHRLSLADEA